MLRGFLLLVPFLTGLASLAQTQTPPPSHPAQIAAAPNLPEIPWTGDLDGMLKRRFIRVLVSYSKSQYYVVKGVQHGGSYEFLKAFEEDINRKFPYKEKDLKFHVLFIPVSSLLSH